jgi:hypothetical protein
MVAEAAYKDLLGRREVETVQTKRASGAKGQTWPGNLIE